MPKSAKQPSAQLQHYLAESRIDGAVAPFDTAAKGTAEELYRKQDGMEDYLASWARDWEQMKAAQ